MDAASDDVLQSISILARQNLEVSRLMDINPIVLSIPIFFGLIAVEWIYDWISKGSAYRANDAFGNISCGIFEQTTGLLIKVASVGLYTWVFQEFRIQTLDRTWLNAIILFLAVDFLYYWAHRMSHEINLFWIGHVVHHQSEDYNLSVALRQGALQKIFTSPFYLPLAILGFSPDWFMYILAWNTLYQFWIHTEKIDKLGWLEWILNTPSHHRVHHGRDPKYIDKNHAATLIIWDRMFGTFQVEEERPHYGITKNIHTFNPIEAHIKPIRDLAEETKGLTPTEAIQLWFAPPGWRPKRLGGREYAQEIHESDKYAVKLSTASIVQLLLLFTSHIAVVALVLFSANTLPVLETTFGIALISWNIYHLGIRANGQTPNKWTEIIGYLAIPAFLHVAFHTLWITLLLGGLPIALLLIFTSIHAYKLKRLA